MKLTKREANLLYVLAFMLINLFGVIYFIQPVYVASQHAKLSYETIKEDYEIQSMYVKQKQNYVDAYHNAQQTIDEMSVFFYDFSSTDQMDAYLDDLLGPIMAKYDASFVITSAMDEEASDAPYKIEIQCEGKYDQLVQVLDTIQNQTKNICVKDFSLVKADDMSHLWAVITLY